MELQRAFVKLMNGCGFARPSALRTSPRTQDTDEDQNDQDDQDEDDDVIVREETQDDQDAQMHQMQESQESDSKQKDELKKEMKENALREEMLLRLIDRGNYSKPFASR